ncbi:MAG: signal peptidase I [Bacillota bacterium]|nr:signal peptidase I [Bacillota bacterium]
MSSFNSKREIRLYLIWILIMTAVVIIINTYFFTFVNVVGSSMEPTLHNGDKLFLVKWGYNPTDSDIIVFDSGTGKPYIKRVYATENQSVIVCGKDYGTVPENSVFVLGDNLGNSIDSRYESVGFVNNKAIMGHALFRIYPFSKIGPLD